MPAKGKTQVKLFLTPHAHDALKRNKDLNGTSMSAAVEDLVREVLEPELKAQAPELPLAD